MAAKCNGVLQELKGCGDQTAKAWDCLKLREFLTWLSEICVPEKKKETSKHKKNKKNIRRFSNLSEQDWRCAKQKTAMFLGKTGSKDLSQAYEMVLHPISTSIFYPSQRCRANCAPFVMVKVIYLPPWSKRQGSNLEIWFQWSEQIWHVLNTAAY